MVPLCAVIFVAATVSSPAITNGLPDGNAHPAIGYIAGTDSDPDNCSGFHQFFAAACTAVLIAPDVILTHASCVSTWQDGLNDGIVDEIWLVLAENPFNDGSWDCTKFRDIDETQFHVNTGSASSLGVMLLASPVTDVTPVDLPSENRGATFVSDTNLIVSMLRVTGPPNLLQRLDSPAARAFLGQFVVLP